MYQSDNMKKNISSSACLKRRKPQIKLVKYFCSRYSTWFWLITFLAIAGVITLIEKRDSTPTNYRRTRITQRCFICDNYASLASDSGFRPGAASGLAWFGGKPVVGGWTSMSSNGNQLRGGLTALQVSRLCSERVNRSAIQLLIDSDNYGECENINYDGCAKIVTKSWRVKPQLGVPTLAAVVVSRTCAAIPEGYGVGCFSSVGGAGMRRTVCYCRGNFVIIVVY
ncbi:unnamed protein product [Heterobilharzia americana]|nr:unnamed protein product [Heterobilharzia americana]